MELRRNIDRKLSRIESLLNRPSIDSSVQRDAEKEMRDVYAELLALESDQAFINHVSEYVREQYEAYQRGDRDEPLCSCRNPCCHVKNGEVPPQLRRRGSGMILSRDPMTLVSEYIQDHPQATVMHELVQAWNEREGELYHDLGRIHGRLEEASPKPGSLSD